ncbi:hypothetical protein ACLOJK_013967 [Asimina triloba]
MGLLLLPSNFGHPYTEPYGLWDTCHSGVDDLVSFPWERGSISSHHSHACSGVFWRMSKILKLTQVGPTPDPYIGDDS